MIFDTYLHIYIFTYLHIYIFQVSSLYHFVRHVQKDIVTKFGHKWTKTDAHIPKYVHKYLVKKWAVEQ